MKASSGMVVAVSRVDCCCLLLLLVVWCCLLLLAIACCCLLLLAVDNGDGHYANNLHLQRLVVIMVMHMLIIPAFLMAMITTLKRILMVTITRLIL